LNVLRDELKEEHRSTWRTDALSLKKLCTKNKSSEQAKEETKEKQNEREEIF